MKYLAVLGRQPEISIAELEAQLPKDIVIDGLFRVLPSSKDGGNLAFFSTGPADSSPSPKFLLRKTFWRPLPESSPVDVNRFGGILKFAVLLEQTPLEYLSSLAEGKLTIGVSDYSKNASRKSASQEALKLKKILVRHGRSVRVVENKDAVLSTATSLHNGLNGSNERKVELIKVDNDWYKVIGVQDIEAYARRDQARPARDAKVGMLPPKLAQILINLCGSLKLGSTVLDPFCGTGVVLQEALLMGYRAYGTDISERMVEYSDKNMEWIVSQARDARGRRSASACQSPDSLELNSFQISQGDATSYTWNQPVTAVACEGYLGRPFSKIPTEMELKEQKQECERILVGFLKNLAKQVKAGTPVVIAVPAWLRSDGSYERLDVVNRLSDSNKKDISKMADEQTISQKKVDDISDLGYNVNNKTHEGLLYHRDGQVVARDILILRKK